jgi:hypothetical protein
MKGRTAACSTFARFNFRYLWRSIMSPYVILPLALGKQRIQGDNRPIHSVWKSNYSQSALLCLYVFHLRCASYTCSVLVAKVAIWMPYATSYDFDLDGSILDEATLTPIYQQSILATFLAVVPMLVDFIIGK